MFIYISQGPPCFTKKLNNWNSGKVCLVARDCLLVVCDGLLVVCGRLLLVCGCLWYFVVICWWFVVVCDRSFSDGLLSLPF